MTQRMWRPYLFFGIIGFIFLLLKVPHVSLRLSDSNVYYESGRQILAGRLLYRDIFFTNLPLFGYISAFYVFISRGNIWFYYLTAIIETLFTAWLLFKLSWRATSSSWIGLATSTLYLFSLITLSTTDHQPGIHTAVMFATLSIYLVMIEKSVWGGISAACAVLTKAYTLPLVAALFIYILVKKRRMTIPFVLSGIATAALVMAPILLSSPRALYDNLIGYSLHREAGVNKVEVVTFYLIHDPLLFISMIASVLYARRYLYVTLATILGIVFLIAYRDVYYFYLNILSPPLILTAALLMAEIVRYNKKLIYLCALVVMCVATFNGYSYLVDYSTLGQVQHVPQIIAAIRHANPKVLYGVDGLTPAFSALSGVPQLENIIDTNENMYRAGIYNSATLTQKALLTHTVLVTTGVNYPEAGVHMPIVNTIFAQEWIKGNCRVIYSTPIYAEGQVNEVNLYKCYQ